ncbi:MAG: hypothetical protein BWY76_01363 [bacterium ADurb.Bin429]|nr:MAG: hypothetical protein BWY76_01363 [bacterium ADurb.Bin429]
MHAHELAVQRLAQRGIAFLLVEFHRAVNETELRKLLRQVRNERTVAGDSVAVEDDDAALRFRLGDHGIRRHFPGYAALAEDASDLLH